MGKDKELTLAERIKSLDFYKDLPRDLAEPTVSGATGNFSDCLCDVISFDVCAWIDGRLVYIPSHHFYAVLED